MALEAIGDAGAGVAMIGDRISSDIEGGRRAGLETILVLSGTSGREDAEAADPPPDHVVENLAAPAAVSGATAAARPAPDRAGLSFAGIFAVTFCGLIAVGSVLPVLPRYVRGPARRRQPRGRDRDRLPTRSPGCCCGRSPDDSPTAAAASRRVLLGALLVGVSGLLYLPSLGLAGLIVARLVLGAGEGSLYTAGSAWIVDLAPSARRGRVLGLYGLAVWGGLSVGPLVGELLLDAGGYTGGLDLRRGDAAARGADRDPRPPTRSSRWPTPSRTR